MTAYSLSVYPPNWVYLAYTGIVVSYLAYRRYRRTQDDDD